jgi:outer membrane protein assembly factor BamB
MDAETGKTMWAATVGDPRWPMLPPAANEDYVATVNGSSLYLLNRTTGEPIWDRPLGMNPTSALAMSSSFVFIPGANGQIEGYRLPTAEDDHRISEPWVFHSSTQVTAAPAIGSTTISWATERGQMFVADLEGPTVLYQFQAGGPIMGQARFLPPDRWVVASTDGYVSALDERTGASKWDFSAGADIDQAPIAQPDATYAVTRQNQLFCVSSEDGLEKWVAPGIQQLLACGKQRLYARGVGGTIVALDKQTGEKLASLSAADYQIGYSNNLTDRVYLMSSSGTLLCLREQTAPLPTLHVPLPQPPERPGTRAREQTSADEPAAAAPPRTDAANDDLLGDDLFGLDDPAADEEPAADAEPAADILDPSDDPAADEVAEEPADEPAADDEEPGAEEQGTEEQGAEEPGTEEADDPFDFG